MPRIALVVLAASALAVHAAGCGQRVPHPPYAPQPTSALVEVAFPPPPARPEGVPAKPDERAVWIDGEWTWRGRRWAWSPGRWVLAPEGGVFSPWTTVIRDDGTVFFAPGVWRNAATGEAIAAPTALATANVASEVVFEPGGELQRTGPTIDPDRIRRRRDGGA
jgi:hypothetical protein